MIARSEWWLMTCSFPSLNWARMRVYEDGSADVFDLDGRLLKFTTVEEAQAELWDDEYRELSQLDADDERDLGIPLSEIETPSGQTDLSRMYQDRESKQAK
jgi:hypothetical protein